MRKMELESWEDLMAKELAMFDAAVEEDLQDYWIDGEPFTEIVLLERNAERWELDPASAEDYQDRRRRVLA